MQKLFIIGLITLSFISTSCQHKEEEKTEIQPLLAVTTPLQKDMTISRDYVAQIHAKRRIEIRSLERGYLQQIYSDEGKSVKRNQLIFKVKPTIYLAELQKYQAEARIAQIEYQNTKSLAESNIVSGNELEINKAKLAKAQAEVSLAKTHLGFTDVRAPFNGIIDHLHVREGSLLEEGELLTTLSDNSKMWVYFNVSESEYLSYIKNKDKKDLKNVALQMADGTLFKHKGIIETIEGEFDNETGNIEFRATFPNPEGMLRHGETGNIIMNIPYKNALVIPQTATFEILDKKYVFVIDKKHVVRQRAITIAEETPHLYILKAGLKPDEKILLTGLRKVRDGQEIHVKYRRPDKVYANLNIHAE